MDPTLVRERHLVRADRLKRGATAASLLGFAAFFGLAAQHVVRGASKSVRPAGSARQRAATARPTAYFDQQDNGFSFGDATSGLTPDVGPSAPPVAQTSVS